MHFSHRATTHTDLVLRARKQGIAYKVIHNASIINAVACCGLQVFVRDFYYFSFCIIMWKTWIANHYTW